MRAAICRHGKIVADTMPDPTPSDGQALVKTLACGICGSDLHALKFGDQMVAASEKTGGGFNMDLKKDLVFGHEYCAEILDYGPNTERKLKPGTRVCSMPIMFGATGATGIGYSNDYPGGYGEQMLLLEGLLLEVPNDLSTERAALTEPMAVGLHAVEKANIGEGNVPLVIGCGPVGLAVIAALKIKGVGPIIAADFSPARRALAETMGADVIIDPSEHSPYQAWTDKAVPEGVDPNGLAVMMGLESIPQAVLFECVGVPGIIQQMLEGAPKNAKIIVVGVCMEQDHITPLFAISKELNLQFVLAYSPEEFSQTLRHIANGDIDVDPLITGKVGIDDVAQAFEDLASPETHAKILVEPWR